MIIRLSLVVVVVRLCVPCDLYLFVERRKYRYVTVIGQGLHGCTQHCRFLGYWCGRVADLLRGSAIDLLGLWLCWSIGVRQNLICYPPFWSSRSFHLGE